MSIPSGNCPVCDKPFSPNDDIVICPECGAPYHRACYQKQGNCVYVSRHGSGFEYKSPAARAESKTAPPPPGPAGGASYSAGGPTVACKSCGTVNAARNIFCERCGAPLHAGVNNPPQGGFSPFGQPGGQPFMGFAAPTMDMNSKVDDIPMADWSRFFGTSSAPAYLLRLKQQEERKSKVSMVLSAFFLGPYYFAYRKMWGWAALAFVLWTLISIPSYLIIMKENGNPLLAGISVSTVELLSQIAWFADLIVRLLCGLFAMYLYRRSAGKTIKALRAQYTNEAEYQEALTKKGGVSALGVVLFVGLTLAFTLAIYPYMEADMLAYLSQFMMM